MWVIVLLVIAAVLFFIASLGRSPSVLHLGWLGAFALTLAFIAERV